MDSTEFDIDGSPESVFQFMIDQDWSDGLPVIPPTADRVREAVFNMLAHGGGRGGGPCGHGASPCRGRQRRACGDGAFLRNRGGHRK